MKKLVEILHDAATPAHRVWLKDRWLKVSAVTRHAQHDGAPEGTIRYEIKSSGGSSVKYGPCEVCGKHASEVFHQWATVAFKDDDYKPPRTAWTYHGAPRSLWGHEECLIKARQPGAVVVRENPKKPTEKIAFDEDHFVALYRYRDALHNEVFSASAMYEVAWEEGYESSINVRGYDAMLKPFEPLAKRYGVDLKKAYLEGKRMAMETDNPRRTERNA